MKYHRIYDAVCFRIPYKFAQDEKTLSGKREVWSFLEKVMFEMDIKRLKVPEIKAN